MTRRAPEGSGRNNREGGGSMEWQGLAECEWVSESTSDRGRLGVLVLCVEMS